MEVVRSRQEPALVVPVPHSFFNISFDKNAGQAILDTLEKDCEPASLEERLAFCGRMNSLHCPHMDYQKDSMLRNLKQ